MPACQSQWYTAWIKIKNSITSDSAKQHLQQMLWKNPLENDDIKEILSFAFFLQVPLEHIVEYFKHKEDVPENVVSLIYETYIDFNNY